MSARHPNPKLLTVKDTAALLAVSVKYVRRHKHDMGFFRLPGGDLRTRTASVEAWIQQHTLPV